MRFPLQADAPCATGVWVWNALPGDGFALRPSGREGEPFGFYPSSRQGEIPHPEQPYILIVEDNSGDAALLDWALNEHGVKLQTVVIADGEKAIGFVQSIDAGSLTAPAVVILDLNLPKRTGLEVLTAIRASRQSHTTPVVVFSSSNAQQDIDAAERLGASRYIRKPSNLDAFIRVGGEIKTFLDGQPE